MLKPVLNPNIVLSFLADYPAENQARQLALFLYRTVTAIEKGVLLNEINH